MFVKTVYFLFLLINFTQLIMVYVFGGPHTFLQHFLYVTNHAICVLCTVLFCGLSELRQQNHVNMIEAVKRCRDVHFFFLIRSTYHLLYPLSAAAQYVMLLYMGVHHNSVHYILLCYWLFIDYL